MKYSLFVLAPAYLLCGCSGTAVETHDPNADAAGNGTLQHAPAVVRPVNAKKTDHIQEVYQWPQWRGPDRTDLSTETGLQQQWPEGGAGA